MAVDHPDGVQVVRGRAQLAGPVRQPAPEISSGGKQRPDGSDRFVAEPKRVVGGDAPTLIKGRVDWADRLAEIARSMLYDRGDAKATGCTLEFVGRCVATDQNAPAEGICTGSIFLVRRP